MEIYGRIKELGKNAKVEADAFMQGLAKKYTNNSSDYLVGFACVSLLVFAMAGMPVYYLPTAL
ncbi:hypothetical protein J4204_06570 [Candidatus Woesearchaeota archaeon]|nr:hypothetical protein [Candidatus Woesearchaeota archaeon]